MAGPQSSCSWAWPWSQCGVTPVQALGPTAGVVLLPLQPLVSFPAPPLFPLLSCVQCEPGGLHTCTLCLITHKYQNYLQRAVYNNDPVQGNLGSETPLLWVLFLDSRLDPIFNLSLKIRFLKLGGVFFLSGDRQDTVGE